MSIAAALSLAFALLPTPCIAGGTGESCTGTISASYSRNLTNQTLDVAVSAENIPDFHALSSYIGVSPASALALGVLPASDVKALNCFTALGSSVSTGGKDVTTMLTGGNSNTDCRVSITTKKLLYTLQFKVLTAHGTANLLNRNVVVNGSIQTVPACLSDPGLTW